MNNDIVTALEAEKELGISRRTIQRWEEWNWFTKGLVKAPNGTRLYNRSHLRWAKRMVAKWEKLRDDDREHLKKLPAIQKRIDRLIRTQPLERTRDPEPLNFREAQAAFQALEQWEKERQETHQHYAKFYDLVKYDMKRLGEIVVKDKD